MFDWLGDIFNNDTFSSLAQGFGKVAPLLNTGASLALGAEGTRNAGNLRAGNAAALANLDELFSPTGAYAQELRKQLERKDAATGRRSQYGTRETELMTNLAKQRSQVLTSPAYQQYLTGANRSQYAPIAGAFGNATGGNQNNLLGQANNAKSIYNASEYLANLFGPAAEASIASGIGGAGSALGAGGLGNVGMMGAEGLSGLSGMLPGYTEAGGPQATGLFGQAAPSAAPLGGFAEGAAMLPGYASTAGTGAGLFGGGLTGAAGAPGVSGLSGLLPGYTATAGTGGAGGLFGGATGASGASGGGAGAASSGLGGLGTAAGVALPAAVLLGGLMSMFQQGTQPIDVSQQWMQNVNAAGGKNMTADQFGRIRGEQPTLNALLDLSMNNGVFDINKYNEALSKATVGGKRFEGDALQEAQNFGQFAAQNPSLIGTAASGPGAWWEQAAQQYGGG